VSVGDDLDGTSVGPSDGDAPPETVVLEVGVGVFDFVDVSVGLGEWVFRVGCGVLVSSWVAVGVGVTVAGGGRTSR
jgi:hypothetical protein